MWYTLAWTWLSFAFQSPNNGSCVNILTSHPIGPLLASRLCNTYVKAGPSRERSSSAQEQYLRRARYEWIQSQIEIHLTLSTHVITSLQGNLSSIREEFCRQIQCNLIQAPCGIDLPPVVVLYLIRNDSMARSNFMDTRLLNGCPFIIGEPLGKSIEEEGSSGEYGMHELASSVRDCWLRPAVPIWNVACGYRHTILLSTFGLCFSFGHGECGRLGHGDEMEQKHPKLITAMAGQIVCAAAAGRVR